MLQRDRYPHQEKDITCVEYANRYGVLVESHHLKAYVFSQEEDGTLYIRLSEEAKGHQYNASYVEASSIILFHHGETSPTMYPSLQAETIELLLDRIFHLTAFYPKRETDVIQNAIIDIIRPYGGVLCLIIQDMFWVMEDAFWPWKRVVAAHVYKTLPSKEADKHVRYHAHVEQQQGQEEIHHEPDVVGISQVQVFEQVLRRYYLHRIVWHALAQSVRRMLKRGVSLSIVLYQTITALLIWLTGIQLHLPTSTLIVLWIISLLVCVDGTLHIRCIVELHHRTTRSLRKHLLFALVYILLGGATFGYERVSLLTSTPHFQRISTQEMLLQIIIPIMLLILPPLLLTASAFLEHHYSVKASVQNVARRMFLFIYQKWKMQGRTGGQADKQGTSSCLLLPPPSSSSPSLERKGSTHTTTNERAE